MRKTHLLLTLAIGTLGLCNCSFEPSVPVERLQCPSCQHSDLFQERICPYGIPLCVEIERNQQVDYNGRRFVECVRTAGQGIQQ